MYITYEHRHRLFGLIHTGGFAVDHNLKKTSGYSVMLTDNSHLRFELCLDKASLLMDNYSDDVCLIGWYDGELYHIDVAFIVPDEKEALKIAKQYQKTIRSI